MTPKEWANREVKAQTAYDEVVVPEAIRLDHHIDEMDDHVKDLRQLQEDRTSWLREHPRPPLSWKPSSGN